MSKRPAVLVFFLLLFSQLNAFDFTPVEDPKSYLTHLRFNYNFTYEIPEIEAKIAKSVDFFSYRNWSFGMLGAITIFIHPTDGFGGYYPVDNLIGAFGFYAQCTNFLNSGLNLILYPIAHESTHLVDGYDRGNLLDDFVFDSNEYLGFDVEYEWDYMALYGGFILYLNNLGGQERARNLIARAHIGQEWSIRLTDRIGLVLAYDIALFYEGRYHPALNVGAGLRLDRADILLHYEYQYGLGQDFEDLQKRLGLECVIR